MPRVTRLTNERRLDLVVGALVLLAYVPLQLWLLQGPQPWDVGLYFNAAVHPGTALHKLFTLRIGLIAPVRAAVLAFGPSEAAFYAAPLGFGFLLAGAVYGTTLALFRDRWVAAAAAFVTVLAPMYLLNSSLIFPDTGGTAVFAAGFLCLLLGARRAEMEEERTLAPAVWSAAAGFLFGWSVLIRDFMPILLPAVVAVMVLLHYPWRRAALLAAVALATVALDPLYAAVQYGRPFLHLRALFVNRSSRPVTGNVVPSIAHFHQQLGDPFDTVAVFPRLLLSWQVGWVFLLLIAVFVVALVVLRDRRLVILGIWCFGVWAIMAVIGLGSLPSGRWILNITNIRYWYPVLPPLAMGALAGGYLLAARFLPPVRGLRVAYSIPAVLAVLAVVPGVAEYRSCAAKDVWASEPRARWHELRAWLARPEADRYGTIFTNKDTRRLSPLFTRSTFGDRTWSGRVRTFSRSDRLTILPPESKEALVLIDKDLFHTSSDLDELRADWSPVFVSEDAAMVLLAHRSTLTTGTAAEESWWQVSDDLAKRRAARGCGANPYALPAA
jgi:hypothetical protein